MQRKLGPGEWINVVNLPKGTQPHHLCAYLQSRGINATEEQVQVHHSGDATIVLDKVQLVDILNWLFAGAEILEGYVPLAEMPRSMRQQ